MEGVATSVSVPSALIRVTHHSAPPDDVGPGAVLLREPTGTTDTYTRIEIWPRKGERRTVVVAWERYGTESDAVSLLLVDTTDTLFIGARTLSAAMRLTSGEIVDPREVVLFWSFEQIGGYVLELGELMCFLRSETGEIVGEVPVDPPYEMHETPEGIRFESPTYGTHWLRFPAR